MNIFNSNLSVTPQDLTGKTVIVTGANIGIGLETARMLASMHASVIIACRSRAKGEVARKDIIQTTNNQDVQLWDLDLGSFDSVREFAKKYLNTGKPLDILINNAGLTAVTLEKTKNGHETTFQVNHLGGFLLTLELLPALKKAAHPRVVNVSSEGHYTGVIDFDNLDGEKETEKSFSFFQSYKNTKLMQVLFTKELARRLSSHEDTKHIVTHALHPGLVYSDIWFKEDYKKKAVTAALLGGMMAVIGKIFARDVVQGAMTSVYVAVDPEPGKTNGLYYDSCKEKEPNPTSHDVKIARRLWEVSAKAVDVDPNIV